MSAPPWAKIWWDWYASRSHVGLSGVALGLGPPLMLLSRPDGSLRSASGRPLSTETFARVVRFPVSDVASALAELVKAGALEAEGDALRFTAAWREVVTEHRRRAPLPREAVLTRDGWVCVYCGADLMTTAPHIDHVTPFSRGGSDEMGNLASACGPCNRSKGARTPEEWRS